MFITLKELSSKTKSIETDDSRLGDKELAAARTVSKFESLIPLTDFKFLIQKWLENISKIEWLSFNLEEL